MILRNKKDASSPDVLNSDSIPKHTLVPASITTELGKLIRVNCKKPDNIPDL